MIRYFIHFINTDAVLKIRRNEFTGENSKRSYIAKQLGGLGRSPNKRSMIEPYLEPFWNHFNIY